MHAPAGSSGTICTALEGTSSRAIVGYEPKKEVQSPLNDTTNVDARGTGACNQPIRVARSPVFALRQRFGDLSNCNKVMKGGIFMTHKKKKYVIKCTYANNIA